MEGTERGGKSALEAVTRSAPCLIACLPARNSAEWSPGAALAEAEARAALRGPRAAPSPNPWLAMGPRSVPLIPVPCRKLAVTSARTDGWGPSAIRLNRTGGFPLTACPTAAMTTKPAPSRTGPNGLRRSAETFPEARWGVPAGPFDMVGAILQALPEADKNVACASLSELKGRRKMKRSREELEHPALTLVRPGEAPRRLMGLGLPQLAGLNACGLHGRALFPPGGGTRVEPW